jgi:hypothetical protein
VTSLFDQNNDPQIDPNKNYLETLVGEGKKFKTVEELARGKAEADLYIETVNKRSDQLREDYLKLRETANTQAKLEDLLARLENAPQRQEPSLQLPAEPVQATPQFDPSKLDSLIDRRVEQREAQMKADANFRTVQNKLKEQFGNSYQTVLQDRMNFLNLSTEDVDTLARKSPSALYNALGLGGTTQDSLMSPPRSTTNSAGFRPQGEPKRTWSYYQDMKKKDPKAYYDPKIANQMHDDAIALGTDFQDGDFNA